MTVNTPTTPATSATSAPTPARWTASLAKKPARTAAATEWFTRRPPGAGKATSWPPRSVRSPRPPRPARVRARENVDVVAVERAEHVGADDLVGRSARGAPAGEVDDAVHHRQQRVDLVRGDQHRDPLLAGNPGEQRDDLVARYAGRGSPAARRAAAASGRRSARGRSARAAARHRRACPRARRRSARRRPPRASPPPAPGERAKAGRTRGGCRRGRAPRGRVRAAACRGRAGTSGARSRSACCAASAARPATSTRPASAPAGRGSRGTASSCQRRLSRSGRELARRDREADVVEDLATGQPHSYALRPSGSRSLAVRPLASQLFRETCRRPPVPAPSPRRASTTGSRSPGGHRLVHPTTGIPVAWLCQERFGHESVTCWL